MVGYVVFVRVLNAVDVGRDAGVHNRRCETVQSNSPREVICRSEQSQDCALIKTCYTRAPEQMFDADDITFEPSPHELNCGKSDMDTVQYIVNALQKSQKSKPNA